VGVYYDDLPDHEGYVRTAAGEYVSACSCGWTGATYHATPVGYDNAHLEWDETHARPLIAVTVPPDLAHKIAVVKAELAALDKQRPRAARLARDDLASWADRTIWPHDPSMPHDPSTHQARPAGPLSLEL
jgi:hypothetical protein